MGYYKNLDIGNQEYELYQQGYSEGDEAWFYSIISDINEATARYGFDTLVGALSPELKFGLLESIIKSQNNQRA